MTLDAAALRKAVAACAFLAPELPGTIEKVKLTGVRGVATRLPDPAANVAGLTAEGRDDPAAAVGRARELFTRRGLGVTWVAGPGGAQASLDEALEAAGFARTVDLAGMVTTDLDLPVSNPAVWTEEVRAGRLNRALALAASAPGSPPARAELIRESLRAGSGALETRAYLAYLRNGTSLAPVASAFMTFLPDRPVAFLHTASTLPEHRRRGVYRSLVARRLADAREAGMEAAVVHAVRSTSAPICARFGFRELGAPWSLWQLPPPQGPAGGEKARDVDTEPGPGNRLIRKLLQTAALLAIPRTVAKA